VGTAIATAGSSRKLMMTMKNPIMNASASALRCSAITYDSARSVRW
jgi:hypothetical protein